MRLDTAMKPTVPTTIPSLLATQAAIHGGRTALAAADAPSLSYADLAATIGRLVADLDVRGVGRTSRPAVVLPNGVDVTLGLLAAASSAIAVPLAPQATADEYRGWFRAGRVTHLLTLPAAASAARDVAAELGLPVLQLIHGADGYRITGGDVSAARLTTVAPPSPADVAVVLMTSGSTGTPKRVPLTHANLLAGAASVAEAVELTPDDRVLVMWEQYHVGGLVDLLLAPLAGGGTVVCAGSFDASRFFELLEAVRPTWFQGVPTTLRELLFHTRLAGRLPVASTLRLLRSVAAPLPVDLMRELEEAFGVPVIQTFGMTEAAPLITTNRLPPGIRKPGSTGTPCGCEVAVLDAAGETLPRGTTGEVAVRGPNVFSGYEDDPETNARVFRCGWFMTGDVGRFDEDGFLHLTGRVKEMINRGGEKIAPAEVEEAAGSHPAVSEAAAFGIPHPTLGEDVGLAVVPRAAGSIDRESIRSHIASHLSRFKVPTVVLVLDKLPRCPIGKIRRRELAELAAKAHEAARSTDPTTSRADEDPLVASLAALWAVHLDLPAVGPDDDFEILGGDSLSRIRLAVAVESLCGVSLPDDAAATITTVRRMADQLRSLGGRVPLAATDGSGNGGPTDLWGDGDASTLADAAPADIRRRLAGSRTIRELDAARESLLNTLSLDELAAVVDLTFSTAAAAWAGRVASRFPWPVRGTERLRVAAELASWRDEVLTASAKAEGSRWQRERLAPSVLLYRRHTPAAARRRLVVGFAGNHQRLMLPTHLILDHLPPHDDLLLIADPDRRHFEAGVRGIAGSFEGVCDWIAGRIEVTDSDAESVVCFGTSGGGLAAICAAHALGCRRGVAVGIDSPANHPALERFLLGQIAATAAVRRPDVILAYDPANRRDLAGGEAVAAVVPNTRTVKLSAAGGHNTLRPAVTAGRLTAILHDLLAADLGQEKSQPSFSASAA